jgi:hypothetical protein
MERRMVIALRLLASNLPRPPWSVFNSNHFATKPSDKLQRMFLFSEAPNVDPLIVAKVRMAARAKR